MDQNKVITLTAAGVSSDSTQLGRSVSLAQSKVVSNISMK